MTAEPNMTHCLLDASGQGPVAEKTPGQSPVAQLL